MGKNYKKTDDQSELVDDLEAINNLIKDRIWIKKLLKFESIDIYDSHTVCR